MLLAVSVNLAKKMFCVSQSSFTFEGFLCFWFILDSSALHLQYPCNKSVGLDEITYLATT